MLDVYVAVSGPGTATSRGRVAFAAVAIVNGKRVWRVGRLPGSLSSVMGGHLACLDVVRGMVDKGTRGRVLSNTGTVAPDSHWDEHVAWTERASVLVELHRLCVAQQLSVVTCSSDHPLIREAKAEAKAVWHQWNAEIAGVAP